MPSSYRFEISPNGRAGCQNKECKDAGLKIKKGELRFGTWVEFTFGDREIQSWKWRHWSCITPTVIQNLLNSLGGLEGLEGDPNIIDGYDEMPQEWQEKILTMLKEGHIPDEDWKGDVEQNRPGKRGSHKKAAPAKKKTGNDGEDGNADGTPTKPKAAKARAKKVKSEAEDDDEDGNLPLRSGGPAHKKRKADFVADDDNLVDEPQDKGRKLKNRKSGHLALMELGNNDEAVPDEKPVKKSRTKKVKLEEKPEPQTAETKKEKQPSRGAKNAREKTTEALKVEDVCGPAEAESSPEQLKKAGKVNQLDGMSDMKTEAGVKASAKTATKPQGKKGGPRKPAQVEEVPEVDEEPKPRARKGRAKKAAKLEEADEEAEDVVDVPVEAEQEAAPAPEPEEETKSKAKAGRKKGLAKPIPKARTKPDY